MAGSLEQRTQPGVVTPSHKRCGTRNNPRDKEENVVMLASIERDRSGCHGL